jgi:hypothetical protein
VRISSPQEDCWLKKLPYRTRLNTLAVDNSSWFDELDKKTQGIVTSLIFNQDKMYPAVLDQPVAITQLPGRIELPAENQKSTTNAVKEMNWIAKKRGTDFTAQGFLTERIVRNIEQGEDKRRLAVAEAIIGSLWFPAMTNREKVIEKLRKHIKRLPSGSSRRSRNRFLGTALWNG